MRFFQLCLLALLTVASCTSLDYPLNVTLTSTGNTAMQLDIQNVGESDLTLVTRGSFFDKRPVKKVTVYSGEGTALAFRGMNVDPKPITATTDVTALHAGQALTVTFDAMAMYDLTSAGNFTAEAVGTVWEAKSAEFIPYKSNQIAITVSQPKATVVKRQQHTQSPSLNPLPPASTSGIPDWALSTIPTALPRSKIQDDCKDDQKKKIKKALLTCGLYADIAVNRTLTMATDLTEFKTYFDSDKEADKTQVSDRLNATSKECTALWYPSVLISCGDPQEQCQMDNTMLSYTDDMMSSEDKIIALCPPAFNLSIASDTDNGMDFGGYLLSEHTKFDVVYKPVTDENVQDFKAAKLLGTVRALRNSGSYRMFAQSSYLDVISGLNDGNGPDDLNSPERVSSPDDLNNPDDPDGPHCTEDSQEDMTCFDPPDSWDGNDYEECPDETDINECLRYPSSTTTSTTSTSTSTSSSTSTSKPTSTSTTKPTSTTTSKPASTTTTERPFLPHHHTDGPPHRSHNALSGIHLIAPPTNTAKRSDFGAYTTVYPTHARGCFKQYQSSPCDDHADGED